LVHENWKLFDGNYFSYQTQGRLFPTGEEWWHEEESYSNAIKQDNGNLCTSKKHLNWLYAQQEKDYSKEGLPWNK